MKSTVDHFLYGAAYYDEYTPADHSVDRDMELMHKAGMNVIRIGESTWATEEPQPSVFDFSSLEQVVQSASSHGISVILGTPTYAVPSWLVRLDPHVLAVPARGENHYGARQIMDIVNGTYRFYAQRIISKMARWAATQPAIIGFQIDNETKHYDSYSPDMQALFAQSLRTRFHDDFDALNQAFGLNYWSNAIHSWADFPDMRGCVNESLRAAFDRFRRQQVAQFLSWQRSLIEKEARDDQFITHNFDYCWETGTSSGLQPGADHFEEADAVTIAGADIYHPNGDLLTGREIVLNGDIARATKGQTNYLVLETEAQGNTGWLPYPGQLRLQAYTHMANGADGVEYWHWSTTHNSVETYWRGVLSHDEKPNRTYRETAIIGAEVAGLKGRLLHLRKHNKVAILVSNDSLTAVDGWFNIDDGTPMPLNDGTRKLTYNAVLRQIFTALFDLNIEADIVPADRNTPDLSHYSLVIAPTLYCASDELISTLRAYVHDGGHLLATPRSFFANPDVRVWDDDQPHGLTDVFGAQYSQITRIAAPSVGGKGVRVEMSRIAMPGVAADRSLQTGHSIHTQARHMIELLTPADRSDVLATYDHYAFNEYAAIVRHQFGTGDAEWIGTFFDDEVMAAVVREVADHAGVLSAYPQLVGKVHVLEGVTGRGEHVVYLLNFSEDTVTVPAPIAGEIVVGDGNVNTRSLARSGDGTISQSDLHATARTSLDEAGRRVAAGDEITIPRWNLSVIASK